MLWYSRRASTRNVDSARRFDAAVRGAVNRVGSRHDVREGGINDAAPPLAPDDEYLVNDVADVARDADRAGSPTSGGQGVSTRSRSI